MNKEAFFSDTSENYCTPPEPEAGRVVRICFRTDREDRVQVEIVVGKRAVPMFEMGKGRRFRYYEITWEMGTTPLDWCFRISDETETVFYDRGGVSDRVRPEFLFELIPGFHTPEWAKGAVMYQIYLDRFCRGDETNDVLDNEYLYINRPVKHIADWSQNPSAFDVAHFYGGDLAGVRKKLRYLKDLGVEVLYFNPIFVSPSNHKYDTQDYEHVDPHLGVIVKDDGEVLPAEAKNNLQATKYICRTADPINLKASDSFFADFVKEAHRMGLRILLDGVFNHCGSFNKWLDREKFYSREGSYAPGAFESKDSPYHDYFVFAKNEEKDWPDNKSYDGWWGNDTLPKLNYEGSPELEQNILSIGRKWLKPPYNVDGWRLDVAADLGHSPEYNHKFWRHFRAAVKTENPNALILAEHYGDPSSWLNGREWDSVMNYDAFMEPVTWFLTGVEKHSDRAEMTLRGDGKRFWDNMRHAMAKFPMASLLVAMNQLSNHDHSRFLTRTNGKVGRLATLGSAAAEEGVKLSVMRQAVVMLMTWPGAPTLYYGDEAGVCGWTDPDSRRTYPWGHENMELIDFHRYMCRFHASCDALKRGSLIPLKMEKDLVCYGRFLGQEKVLVYVYTGEEDHLIDLPVRLLGIEDNEVMRRYIRTAEEGYNVGVLNCVVSGGCLTVRVSRNSAGIYAIRIRQ